METVIGVRVFISYSRRDSSDLAENLVAGLEAAGFKPYLDRHDIVGAEDWEERLGKLILSADTVIFILSPASVKSERCEWEVERAQALGKRLIPVVGIQVPELEVPVRLRRLNYVFFHSSNLFAKSLRDLSVVLRQDIEWIREHTRLSEAAAHWKSHKDRSYTAADDLLLRGEELTTALAWIDRRSQNAPEITLLLSSFLEASKDQQAKLANEEKDRLAERERLLGEREHAQRSVKRVQRRWSVALGALTGLVAAGTATGIWIVFTGWLSLMTTRAELLAPVINLEVAQNDPVTAMLIGLDALPDATSAGLRQRMLRPDFSGVNELDGAFRHWSGDFGERLVISEPDDTTVTIFSPDGRHILSGSANFTARLWDVSTGEPVVTFSGHTGTIRSAAFSPDGTRVLTGSDDATARLWETSTGKTIATLSGHIDGIVKVAFSPDGGYVATGSRDSTIRIWNASNGRPVTVLSGFETPHGGGDIMDGFDFSPDGRHIVTPYNGGTARVWDTQTGAIIATLTGFLSPVVTALFCPDGYHILINAAYGVVRLYDLKSGKIITMPDFNWSWAPTIAFSSDGTRFFEGLDDANGGIWDVATGTPISTFKGSGTTVFSATFLPDGSRVLTASSDGVRLWNAETGDLISTFAKDAGSIDIAVPSPDGKRVIIKARNNAIYVWAMPQKNLDKVLKKQRGTISSVAFSPNGLQALTGSLDKTAILWDVSTGNPLKTLSAHTDAVNSVAFAPDGLLAITGSSDGTARLWNLHTGVSMVTFAGHMSSVDEARFSPDGKTVLTISEDSDTASMWDAESGKLIRTFSGSVPLLSSKIIFSPDGSHLIFLREIESPRSHVMEIWNTDNSKHRIANVELGFAVSSVDMSSDGSKLAVTGYDGNCIFIDPNTGDILSNKKEVSGVFSSQFSPDGKILALGMQDGTILLRYSNTLLPMSTTSAMESYIQKIVFSPDSSRVLAISGKAARLWDVISGKPLATLNAHSARIFAAQFSLDGVHIITGSEDNTARLWTLFNSTQDLVETVKSIVPKCLTLAQREEFHLDTPTPRWCYTRHLWPFEDQAQPPSTWDERFVRAWDWINVQFHSATQKKVANDYTKVSAAALHSGEN